MKAKALVIITPGFAANEADTTCLPPRQMFVKALHKAYPETKIIVLALHYPFRKDHYYWNGVQVISLNGKDRGKGFRLLTWLAAWRQLHLLKKQYDVLGILSFWLGECALVGKHFAKRNTLKHYIWLLGQDAKANNRFYRRVKPHADELIALSDFVADGFETHYGIRPANIVPVGIETELFGTKEQHRDIDILGAGSLIPLKQYHLFIEVIRFVSYFFPQINAVICGKGLEYEKLNRMIIAYGLQANIHLLNELPHTDVLKLMQRSKVFLHPSSYEGYGTVLAEALYAGAHVVSFCKPMQGRTLHHNVATNVHHMQNLAVSLLKQQLDHTPVITHTAEQVAIQIMDLFTGG